MDMKEVACVVLFTPTSQWTCSLTVYLLHISRHKIISFLHLKDDYPTDIGCIVYNSMLYMFGGCDRITHLADAYVLDLFQLSKSTSSLDKPSLAKLPPMNSCKGYPGVALLGNKICVFDTRPGRKPTASHFELFDPHLNTWTQLPDPCSFTTGCLVDSHYVKDDSLFIFISKKEAVFVLSIGAATSPYWSHVDIRCSHLRYDPFGDSAGVIFGSWLVCINRVYDLEDDTCFGRSIGCVAWTDETGTKPYDIIDKFGSKILRLGSDRVCTIEPAILYKPKHIKPKVQKVKIDGRKSMLIQQSAIRKRQGERKGSFRMIVKVWSVNAITENGAHFDMEVLKSFTVPIYRNNSKCKSHSMPLYPCHRFKFDRIKMVSLCHP